MSMRRLVYLSLFVAIKIVFTRFISIQTPIKRIGFSYIPSAIGGALFGCSFAAITSFFSDLIGHFLWPQGPFMLSFTIVSTLSGMLYGYYYRHRFTYSSLLIIILIKTFVLHLGINTLSLTVLREQPFKVLFYARLWPSLFTSIIEFVVNTYVIKKVVPRLGGLMRE